jgi:hypothetical protein
MCKMATEIDLLIREITAIVDEYIDDGYVDTINSHLCDDLGICPTELPEICELINEKFGTALDARSDESVHYCKTITTLAHRVFEELSH